MSRELSCMEAIALARGGEEIEWDCGSGFVPFNPRVSHYVGDLADAKWRHRQVRVSRSWTTAIEYTAKELDVSAAQAINTATCRRHAEAIEEAARKLLDEVERKGAPSIAMYLRTLWIE